MCIRDRGYDAIDLYGVTHRRIDHFMAVLCLLEKYQDISITIYDEWNKIFVLKPGQHYLAKDQYQDVYKRQDSFWLSKNYWLC